MAANFYKRQYILLLYFMNLLIQNHHWVRPVPFPPPQQISSSLIWSQTQIPALKSWFKSQRFAKVLFHKFWTKINLIDCERTKFEICPLLNLRFQKVRVQNTQIWFDWIKGVIFQVHSMQAAINCNKCKCNTIHTQFIHFEWHTLHNYTCPFFLLT